MIGGSGGHRADPTTAGCYAAALLMLLGIFLIVFGITVLW